MRKVPAAVTLTLVLPVLTVLPVASPSTARAHAVQSDVAHLALGGIDPAALAATGTHTLRLSALARAAEAGAVRGSAPVTRPAVLTAERHVHSFQLVGVSWVRPATPTQLTVLVRTHGHSGWSSWQSLGAADTSETGTREATDPYYAGPSDGVQLRVDVRSGALPAGLRADLVDPGSSRFDAQVGRTPSSVASADAAQPQIFSRAEWGADESKRGALHPMSTIKAGVLHHTAGINGYSEADVPKIIRGLYAYDLANGWADIAYNMLVDRFGRAWEGRANSVTATTLSGATGGFNPYTYAVSVMGNYDVVQPDSAVIDTLARLFAWKLGQYHRDPAGYTRLVASVSPRGTSRYPEGTAVTLPVIFGHRDVGNTACPGQYLYPYMSTIRSTAEALTQAAVTNPTVTATSVAYQGGGTLISAGVIAPQSWNLAVTNVGTGATVAASSGSATPDTGITAAWDGRLPSGEWAPVGSYQLTLTSASAAGPAVPFTTTLDVGTPPPPPVAAPVAAPAATPGTFFPVAPVRLLDTRRIHRPIGTNRKYDVTVAGVKGVPSGATSAVLNVTATGATAVTHLTAWPAGGSAPTASSLNLPPGVSRAALVAVGIGSAGKVSIRNNIGSTQVVVDLVGYSVSPGSGAIGSVLAAIPGQRIYDSRTAGNTMLAKGEKRTITLPALAGIDPSQVTAVAVNLTVTRSRGPGYLTAYPPGRPPLTSTLNFAKGEIAANRAVVGVTNGQFVIRDASPGTHVAVDVVGVYAPATVLASGGNVVAVRPVRVLDTRVGNGAALGVGGSRDVTVAGGATGVPATGVKAVLATLTGVRPNAVSHLVLYPKGGSFPATSDVNVSVGDVRANLVMVPVGVDNQVTVFNNAGSQHAVLDVVGYVQ